MKGRIVDLTVTVDVNTKSPPSTDLKVELTRYHRGPGFWQVTAISQSLHTGSHVDSPLHCYERGGTTAEIPLDRVIGEAFVLDCSHVEPEQPIEVRDLGTAILLVEENLRQALSVASRVYVMGGGRITLHRAADSLRDADELRLVLAGALERPTPSTAAPTE